MRRTLAIAVGIGAVAVGAGLAAEYVADVPPTNYAAYGDGGRYDHEATRTTPNYDGDVSDVQRRMDAGLKQKAPKDLNPHVHTLTMPQETAVKGSSKAASASKHVTGVKPPKTASQTGTTDASADGSHAGMVAVAGGNHVDYYAPGSAMTCVEGRRAFPLPTGAQWVEDYSYYWDANGKTHDYPYKPSSDKC